MDVMHSFGNMTGLHINVSKSSIFITGIASSHTHSTSTALDIPISKLLIRYLSLPLTSKAMTRADYEPRISKVCSTMTSWASKMLLYAGRMQLIRFHHFVVFAHQPWKHESISFCNVNFATEIWRLILQRLNLNTRMLSTWDSFMAWQTQKQPPLPCLLQKLVSQTAVYHIWKQRNNIYHNAIVLQPSAIFKTIDREIINTINARRRRRSFYSIMPFCFTKPIRSILLCRVFNFFRQGNN